MRVSRIGFDIQIQSYRRGTKAAELLGGSMAKVTILSDYTERAGSMSVGAACSRDFKCRGVKSHALYFMRR